ncbi:NADH-FMN oxidoreductase RutF, flavin reductase (DIM6/NTAB) family [Roseomonas rosea]|uniref:NADH-FMN oxidoreductase RutF, flavin reductase (DIM6/NTAB) family n=1 Tax=Muricoccus roseus TaxID=198092 RepID=A0A1M6RX60_9PROT|nr:flavin reductase family protein [Roseomonas rosea]SHK37082.1 NADH-FMN oxidoreductase RutF, flavin reductase (DIM6/NTAB) family [Roseomonas rosea]
MFYEPRHGHGLPWDPFKAIVAPRPIGWISTIDERGRVNLAPYSYFAIVHNAPPMIAFGSEGLKHSAANARATGEFTFSLATRALFDAMNASSGNQPEGVSEFDEARIPAAPSRMVRPPRVADSPAALECRVVHAMELQDQDGRPSNGFLTIGQVVGVHIDERCLKDGRFDMVAAGTIARCGYRDYAQVTELFEALRPTDGGVFPPGGGPAR